MLYTYMKPKKIWFFRFFKEKEADALLADIQIKTHDENLKEENFSSEDCENIKLKDKEIVKLQDNCNNETTEVSNNETHMAVGVSIPQTDPSVVSINTDIDIADGKVNDAKTITEGTDITYVPTAESQFPTETLIANSPSTTMNPVAPPRRKRKDKKNSKVRIFSKIMLYIYIDLQYQVWLYGIHSSVLSMTLLTSGVSIVTSESYH